MDDDNPIHLIEVPSSGHDEFCDVCKEIRIDGLFYQEGAYIWDDYVYNPPTRPLKHILENQQCPFCRLTLSAFHGSSLLDRENAETLPITAVVESTGDLSLYKNSLNESSNLDRWLCRLWFYDGSVYKYPNGAYNEYDWEPYESFQIQLLHDDTIQSQDWMKRAQSYRHTRLVTKRIQTKLVKSWLQYCERNHKEPDGPDPEEFSGREDAPIRLLDVENCQIVDATTGFRYFALSYVWGNSNFMTLNQANRAELYGMHGLSKIKIPKTISDAMTLCAQLGERYLWVDSLCIQQDDEGDKVLQIQHMEMIYRKAVMTIANTSKSNNSADMPLPGVQSNSRVPFQQVHSISGLKVVVSRRYAQPQAKQISTWATRAWTMQEEILSSRILYISDTHCWFQCPDCYFSEDLYLESAIEANELSISTEHSFSTNMIKAFRPFKERKLGPTWIKLHSSSEMSKPTIPYALHEVFDLIETYTARHATLQSDTLRAIDGLLTRASKLDEGIVTTYHYGLPVAAFDYALCWLEDEHDPNRRRPGFPSWSWAGWMSIVTFPMGNPSYKVVGMDNTSMSLFTNAVLRPEAKAYDLNISVKSEDDMEDRHSFVENFEENRSFDELRNSYGIHVSPKASIHTNRHSGEGSSITGVNNDQSLMFSTSYAKLRVDAASTGDNVATIDNTSSCELYTLRSPGDPNVLLGSIRLNRAWRIKQSKILDLDFIVIRAAPSEKFEPYWHTSQRPDPSKSPAPADWKVFLMCVAWIDGDTLEGKLRKAERITMAMVQERRRLKWERKVVKGGQENMYYLPSVGDWMSVEPRPVEVLVELV